MSVPRHIELWLSGFEADPAMLVARHPELRILPFAMGSAMRSGRLRETNWLIVERHFGYLTTWDEALDGLVAALGAGACAPTLRRARLPEPAATGRPSRDRLPSADATWCARGLPRGGERNKSRI